MKLRRPTLVELEMGLVGIPVAVSLVISLADYGARIWRLLN